MERENKKRGREEGKDKKDLFVQKSEDESDISSDNYFSLGVFDFPWLHDDDDGIISKSEEWKFEDTFFSSLDDIEFARQCLYETTTTMHMNMDMNFEIDELEFGNVDCSTWSSMNIINQPLQHNH